MAWTTYKEQIKQFSEQLIEIQRPIRILNSIKVNMSIVAEFQSNKYKQPPALNEEYYQKIPLGFDPEVKTKELYELKQSILLKLGSKDELGQLLIRMVEQYLITVEMLKNRGTVRFYECSKRLYGSPKDKFIEDKNRVIDMAHMLYEILCGVDASLSQQNFSENLTAQDVVNELNLRFSGYFGEGTVEAKISDGIIADAAAGGDTVKIREGAMFASREIDIYEVHEGWVHVGTTMNGRRQPVSKFLSIGPPHCASTQEGLAVIMEIFTFRSYPRRAKQINDRIICIDKAEDGANLLDIIEYFRTEGYSEKDCMTNALRVFRGGNVLGGAPFTKDISYCKGFVENYNFFRTAIRANKPQLIPFIFIGKLHVDDIPLLYSKHREGLVDQPIFLPPQFKDLHGLAVWMSFSSFFNRVDLVSVQTHYNGLFSRYT
ncbi:MAG: flavohemoglobin expression-modulating QEGLA motif protein [Bdellovibrionales bacterium]|nr:flavohemoglobin expression-modulating QEGLA motif protein [Bdellovibrionales bacterium]